MMNAIEPGSVVPIHRHQKTSETVVCLRGRLVEEYYQEFRDESLELRDSLKVQKVQEIELSPNGSVVALNIPAGQWHTLRAVESGSVIIEMKDGAYEPLQGCDVLSL